MTKLTANVAPSLRTELADTLAAGATKTVQAAELQERYNRIAAAAAELESVRSDFRELALAEFENDDTPDLDRRGALRRRLAAAKAAEGNIAQAKADLDRINPEIIALGERSKELVREIVRAEIPALSATYHAHVKSALKAEAALVQLKNWALSAGLSELAVELVGATRLDPDPAVDALLLPAFHAEIAEHGAQWWHWPAALMSDPFATVKD